MLARYLSVFIILSTSFSVLAKSGIEVTPFASYRFGGDFNNDVTEQSYELDDNSGVGIIIAWPFDHKRQGELLFSYNDTKLTSSENTDFTNSNVAVSYLHLGGNIQVHHGVVPLWITGGFGATYLDPDDSELNSETQFSVNLGLQTRWDVNRNISFLMGGRVFGTLWDSDSAVLCNNDTCKIYVDGDIWIQSELSAGLVFKF